MVEKKKPSRSKEKITQMSEQEELIRQLREENALLKQASKMQEDRIFEMKQEHSSSMSKMEERIERLQKKLNVWRSFFSREFVAVIVGATLLIIFAGFLMVSMYNHIPTTEVIANGFFVLLGFFFSQTTKDMPSQKDGTDEMLQK